VREGIGFCPQGITKILLPPIPGQETARQRTPGDEADALRAAERDHFPSLFPVDQVVVVLHGHESEMTDATRFRIGS
jgi:hypothetical protein